MDINNLELKQMSNELISLEQNRNNFDLLMSIYSKALDKTYNVITHVQERT